MRDLIMLLCARGQEKVFSFVIDPKKGHFFSEVNRHEDKLTCQNEYFKYYSRICPELLQKPDDIIEEQVLGHCFIHPTADIHPTAVLGPNVSIGAYVKIHEGVRVVNSIVLEDAEIQAHSVIINSMVGWNSKVGPWCRIEGTLFSDERLKFLQG